MVPSQGGNRAFVPFPLAATNAILDGWIADALVIVVRLSMLVTPVAFVNRDRMLGARARRPQPKPPESA